MQRKQAMHVPGLCDQCIVGCQLHLSCVMLLLQLQRLPFMCFSLYFERTLQFGDHYILGCQLHLPRFMLLLQLRIASPLASP